MLLMQTDRIERPVVLVEIYTLCNVGWLFTLPGAYNSQFACFSRESWKTGKTKTF